jgi:acyl-CoA thioesterase-1
MRTTIFAAICIAFALARVSDCVAAEIVALGASNTFGRGQGAHPDGVPTSQAYPAQLQALLARQGCNVTVLNAGIPGNTSGQMLARFDSSIGADTRVLIFQPGGNDARKGQSPTDNIAEIRRRAQARGIKVIMLENLGRMAPSFRLPDGQHFSAEGHAVFANYLVRQIMSAGVCKK